MTILREIGDGILAILVEISTKDRDAILGDTLAALLNQSYRNFDVLILNDGDSPVGRARMTKFFLDELRASRTVWIEDGSHISQAHNHNIALYQQPWRDYEHILRLDDDIVLNRHALRYMVEDIRFEGVDAVGGLWFESEYVDEQWHNRGVIYWDLAEEAGTDGIIAEDSNNWQQKMYHPTNDLYRVQHLYSACLYDAEKLRKAGGWPEVYSKGVAHGEETDGTYRLHLSGAWVCVDPRITGQHKKSAGGIRSADKLGAKQYLDNLKWRERLPEIKQINFSPTIAVWCQHSYGIGGAQRQFYQTIHLLQETELDIYPIFSRRYYSPEECEEIFGFSYEERPQLDKYDVCIVMGHQPMKPVKAKHYIGYMFFPDKTEFPFDDFDLLLGNSVFTADWIKKIWRYKAHHVYPVVTPVASSFCKKENIVLAVCRGDPHKAPLRMMEIFLDMCKDFPGGDWEFHLVLSTTGGVYTAYEQQIKTFGAERRRVVVHENVSNDQLADLYWRAKVLWAANGMYAEQNPKAAEHFGLVPIEAFSAECIPVVYDFGGHQETVDERFRWKTIEELKARTIEAIQFYGNDLPAVVDVAKYNKHDYVEQWTDWIYRVSGMAVELEKIEAIEIKDKKIRVAMLCDSPLMPEYNMGLTTGFGVVAQQVLRGFLKQKDFDVSVFAIMDRTMEPRGLPYRHYRMAEGDLQGKKMLPEFLKWAQPDVVWTLYDPGAILGQLNVMMSMQLGRPVIGYFPIEGIGRIPFSAYKAIPMIDYPVTYCQAGKRLIDQVLPGNNVIVLPHGADHADFRPLDQERRRRLREMVGWNDRFVIVSGGTNKRVKQQPILIEAMKMLLRGGHDDVLMYLHTLPYDSHVMQGWGLDWIIEQESIVSELPLKEHILFPNIYDKWRGPAYRLGEIEEWRLSAPPDARGRGAIFEALDYVTRLGLADLYVDVSAAEGWGLMPLESAACGVPTISVNDGMARSEYHSKYCHMLSPNFIWDTWHTGARLSHVYPAQVASTVLGLKLDSKVREKYSEQQKHILTDLPWKPTVDSFVELVRDAVSSKT